MLRKLGGPTVACLALLCLGSPVAAADKDIATDEAALPARDQSEIDREKVALVRRYFAAIRIEELVRRTMEGVAEILLSREQVRSEHRFAIAGSFDRALADLTPGLIDDFAELYAGAFTLEELNGLVAFYESPLGRSVMTKTPGLTQAAAELMSRSAPLFEQAFATEFRTLIAQAATEAGTPEPPLSPPIPMTIPPPR